MNILVISHMYPSDVNPVSGIFVYEQVMALRQQGCKVVVVSPVPFVPVFFELLNDKWKLIKNLPLKSNMNGVEIYRPRYFSLIKNLLFGFSGIFMFLAVKKIVLSISKIFDFDLIHAHTIIPDGYVAFKLSKYFDKPCVCTMHGSDINLYPGYGRISLAMTKKVIFGADQMISVSNFLKIKAEAIARPKNSIKVVYNGCDQKEFVFDLRSRILKRRELNIPVESRVLIFTGGLQKTKGIFELLGSFSSLFKQFSQAHLIIVGNGNDVKRVMKILSMEDMKNNVHLVGRQPYNKIPCFLSAGDIFVLPSYSEGLPVSVIEAMACSRPVIATRVGGIPEIVKDKETGMLVEPENVESLTKAILYLINNEQECAKMGSSGRKIVESGFSWEKSAERLTAVYADILKEAR